MTNFLFVPGYKNGTAPFGEWPAVKLASPDGWRASSNSSYDFSAAQVATNGSGASLNDVVGGRGIAFNQARKQNYSSFGYPAQQPPLEFDGRREFRCNSTARRRRQPARQRPGHDVDRLRHDRRLAAAAAGSRAARCSRSTATATATRPA